MPSRLTLILALAVVALLGLWAGSKAWEYRALANDRFDQVTQLEARLAGVQAEVLQVEFNKNRAQQKLQGALDASPEWSGTAVPSAVADSLCEYLDCSSALPQAPGPD